MGTIPKTWKVVSINSVKDYNHPYPIGDGDHGQISPDDYLGEGVPYIRVQNLTWEGQLNLDNVVYISEKVNNANSKSILRPNDILVAKTGATIGKTAIMPETVPVANTTSSVGKLTVSPKYSSKYVYYVLSSDVCLTQMWIKAGQKTAQPGFNIVDLAAFRIPFPGVSEQHAIADYLDERCSKIDEIIAEATASIEEYKELKQAVIFEAVTKGLDKNASMKDSGVEWIGSVPYDWRIVKATRIIEFTQNGITRRDLEKSSGEIVLKLRNINADGQVDYSNIERIELSDDELSRYMLLENDLLFVRVNGSKDLVGKCAIFKSIEEPVAYNDHIIRVRLNHHCEVNYFKWMLLSNVGKREIASRIKTSAGQHTISGQDLRDILVLLPPTNKQTIIADYLEKQSNRIESLISEKRALIEDLQAYKKSLIYEVVTGKRRIV